MTPRFQVGDKVTLAFDLGTTLGMVPQLAMGRVYCVREVSIYHGKLFGDTERVSLVGVRRDRRHREVDDAIPAAYFRPVGRLSRRQS